jgi:hypothetical protein
MWPAGVAVAVAVCSIVGVVVGVEASASGVGLASEGVFVPAAADWSSAS